MQSAEPVLDVLRERGRRGLPCDELYRQLFNPQLYLLAYGRIYSNKGAMTPGPDAETADGMTLGKIERIINALRQERYRFKPVKRVYIPKKDGKQRPLGLPSWSDKLVGEVVRLLCTTSRSFPIIPISSMRCRSGLQQAVGDVSRPPGSACDAARERLIRRDRPREAAVRRAAMAHASTPPVDTSRTPPPPRQCRFELRQCQRRWP